MLYDETQTLLEDSETVTLSATDQFDTEHEGFAFDNPFFRDLLSDDPVPGGGDVCGLDGQQQNHKGTSRKAHSSLERPTLSCTIDEVEF